MEDKFLEDFNSGNPLPNNPDPTEPADPSPSHPVPEEDVSRTVQRPSLGDAKNLFMLNFHDGSQVKSMDDQDVDADSTSTGDDSTDYIVCAPEGEMSEIKTKGLSHRYNKNLQIFLKDTKILNKPTTLSKRIKKLNNRKSVYKKLFKSEGALSDILNCGAITKVPSAAHNLQLVRIRKLKPFPLLKPQLQHLVHRLSLLNVNPSSASSESNASELSSADVSKLDIKGLDIIPSVELILIESPPERKLSPDSSGLSSTKKPCLPQEAKVDEDKESVADKGSLVEGIEQSTSTDQGASVLTPIPPEKIEGSSESARGGGSGLITTSPIVRLPEEMDSDFKPKRTLKRTKVRSVDDVAEDRPDPKRKKQD